MGNCFHCNDNFMGVEIMNKKGEFLVRDFIVVLVLFGIVTGIGALIVVDVADYETGYGVENMTDKNFQERYDSLSETTKNVELMQNATTSTEGLKLDSIYTEIFSGTFNIVGIIFGSFGVLFSTLSNFMSDFGVPSGLANLMAGGIFAIILSTIIFVIMSSISKGRM